MSVDIFDKVMGILERNQYQVVLTTTETGFIIQYPERIEYISSPARIDEVHIYDDGLSINGKLVSIPKYLQMSYSITLMIKGCKKIHYAASLVRYIHNNKDISDEEFWDIVSFNMSPEEKELSDQIPKLVTIYVENQQQAIELANNINVLDGLQRIVGLLQEKIDE